MMLVAASSSSDAAPGTLGFLVVFGMAVLLFFVFRSMSKHIRKVNGVARKDQAAGSPQANGRDVDAASASSGGARQGNRREDS